MLEFRILGPFEVRDADRAVSIRGRKQRALLALLAVNADRTLAVERIVDELWGEQVPETASKMVQIYVSQLRKLLPGGMLVTRPPGYALELVGEQLDLRRFERLFAEGRAAFAAGDAPAAAALLAEAEAVWRGPALAEFGSEPFAAPEGARLEERRVAALEERIEAELACGRHADLVGELESLVGRYPLREGLRRRQMLALYRCGRQAEALAAYQEAHRVLADELGLEPSASLRELQRQILGQDPALNGPATARPTSSPQPPVAAAAAQPVTALCATCGAQLPPRASFCSACGADVDAPPAPEMRKLATMLFADVVESSARVGTLDPEEARALMGDFFEAMAAEIAAEGGAIEKFVGDAIMAVFGVPAAHEDDPERAVRAGRRMIARLAEWNAAREPAAPLDVRIGINTGEVLAAGTPGQHLLVTGEAVSVAARLQQAAEPGAILIGERTARAVEWLFELRALKPFSIKGKAEPVAAWIVGEQLELSDVRRARGLPSPLVGRKRQLELLITTFAGIRGEGMPHLVSVVGDAGVGKSRLLQEFAARVQADAKVVVGRCLPYGEGVTLWPLVEILEAEAGVRENDAPAVVIEKVQALVEATMPASLAPNRARSVAALASTLGHSEPGVDPHENYHALISAWRALLTGLASAQPLVVVIEDLHWADQLMLDVLDDLAEHVEGAVLLLCTARPDLFRTRPDWGGARRRFSSLPLDPLSTDESARMVTLLLDAEELPGELKARILSCAEGNPFYLEEIVRGLIDYELLVPEGGRWRAREEVFAIEMPDSVQAVILARIDLLSASEKSTLQRAAVIGRVFWSGALARLTSAEGLDEILRTLRRRELIVERLSSSMTGEVEYQFKHVLIRDVAYESLPRRQRATAHAQAAAWIEQVSGERATDLAEILAHHYEAAFVLAGDDEHRRLARSHALVAADNAHHRRAIDHAGRFARRAVELSAPGQERTDALEAVGDIAFAFFDGAAAFEAYRAAVDDAPDDGRRARLAAKAAIVPSRWLGSMNTLPERDLLEQLIADGLRAAGAGDSFERSLLLSARAFTYAYQYDGREQDAGVDARAALEIAERLDDPQLLSCALDAVATLDLPSGRYGQRRPVIRRRLELVPRLTDSKEIGDVLITAAWNAFNLGLFSEALELAEECVERTRDVDPGAYVHGLSWRVLARFMTGEWQGALDDQVELDLLIGDAGDGLPLPFSRRAYAIAAFCHELRGDREASDRCLETVRRCYAEPNPSRVGRRNALAPACRALAHRGQVDEVRALFLHDPSSKAYGTALEALCDITAAAHDWTGARETVEMARAWAEETGLIGLPFFADRLEGQIATAEGNAAEATVLLERAARGFADIGAVWEEAYARLLLGEASSDPDQLEAALAVFERLGSVTEIERVRGVLAG